jgi:hypothetical protein
MTEDDGALLQLWLQPATATMTTMATSGDYESNESNEPQGRSKREIEDGEEVRTMSALEGAKVRAYEPTASQGVQP